MNVLICCNGRRLFSCWTLMSDSHTVTVTRNDVTGGTLYCAFTVATHSRTDEKYQWLKISHPQRTDILRSFCAKLITNDLKMPVPPDNNTTSSLTHRFERSELRDDCQRTETRRRNFTKGKMWTLIIKRRHNNVYNFVKFVPYKRQNNVRYV